MAYECDDDIDRKQYEVIRAYEEIAQEVSSDKRFDTGESFVNEDRGFQARYTFTGKELDKETGYQYFGARYNEPARLGWLSVDPLSDKYPSLSPYVYCANNPVMHTDPDGRVVKPASVFELIMIQHTLPKEARANVKLDNHGCIDPIELNLYGGESCNFNNLKTMVNSEIVIDVKLDKKFTFMRPDGQLGTAEMSYIPFEQNSMQFLEADKDKTGSSSDRNSEGVQGFLGKVLFPDRGGIQNSPTDHIIVIVNKGCSPGVASEIFSHEGYGHALLYLINGGDHHGASHQVDVEGDHDYNTTLTNMIIKAKQETIKNR